MGTPCPMPFLNILDFPATGGEIANRVCAPLSANATCCLPCPITDWVFPDAYNHQYQGANYLGIVGFVVNILLLLTFWILPEEQSHRHYLGIGLASSLALLSLGFLIPIGTKPDQCYNDITPNNMHSAMSCAWTGALCLTGGMGAVVWVLLRSIWTALRVIFDFKRTDIFKYISLAFGIIVPLLLLTICLTITGLSYKIANVCMPYHVNAMQTWFGWLIAFGGLSAIILAIAILYCLWKFALSALAGGGASTGHRSQVSTTGTETSGDEAAAVPSKRAARCHKKVEWDRVKKVLRLQWRTIVLAFIMVNESIYFGLIFISQTAASNAAEYTLTTENADWADCIVRNAGDKNACLSKTSGLGLSEPRVMGALYLAALLGPLLPLLMLRWSMFTGWLDIIRNPSQLMNLVKGRRPSVGSQDFIMQTPSKHVLLSKPLASESEEGLGRTTSVDEYSLAAGPAHEQMVDSARWNSVDLEGGESEGGDAGHMHQVERDEDEVVV